MGEVFADVSVEAFITDGFLDVAQFFEAVNALPAMETRARQDLEANPSPTNWDRFRVIERLEQQYMAERIAAREAESNVASVGEAEELEVDEIGHTSLWAETREWIEANPDLVERGLIEERKATLSRQMVRQILDGRLRTTSSPEFFTTLLRSSIFLQSMSMSRPMFPDSDELAATFFRFPIDDPELEDQFVRDITGLLKRDPRVDQSERPGRYYNRIKFGEIAKQVLGISNHDEFIRRYGKTAENSTITPSQQRAVAFLRSVGYNKGKTEAGHIYGIISGHHVLITSPAKRKRVYNGLMDPELRAAVVRAKTPERLLRQGLVLLEDVIDEAAAVEGATNAALISEALANARAGGILPYSRFISLANQLSRRINQSGLLSEKEHLEDLDIHSIADLPLALSRFLFAIYNLGTPPEALLDLEEKHREIVFIAEVICSGAVDRKLAQQPITVGDVIMRFPNASPEQLQMIIDDLERGKTLKDIHYWYRQNYQLTGGRTYWTKNRRGYGFLS